MNQEVVANTESTVEQAHAILFGEKITSLPEDLYIPPDALRVFLETFQGPLDLLLYLIRKQNIDILDIPIAAITRQYMEYVELMREIQFELAAEYLVMAAMLAEIKSRMLLPRQPQVEEEEGDPRAELVRRLQEYERFKNAAERLDELPRVGRETFVSEASIPETEYKPTPPEVNLEDLFSALREVMKRSELFAEHQIKREVLSIRERMTIVLTKVKADAFTQFADLFSFEEGRMGVVVTLIAILELVRQKVLDLVQSEPYAAIYVKAKS